MQYKLVIHGKHISLNAYIDACRRNPRAGGRVKSASDDYVMVCISNQLRKVHIDKPVRVDFVYFCEDRKKDIDNIAGFAHKTIFDSLVKKGVLKNDSWNYVLGFTDTFYIDRKDPRTEVTITEVEYDTE